MFLAVFLYGTMGVYCKLFFPDMGSATLATMRGFVGALFVFVCMRLTGRKPDAAAIRRNLWIMCISGVMIGINWALLYESYKHTSIALATLYYYVAPVFMILASPFITKEKLTARKLVCVGIALFGMVCISGVFGGGDAFTVEGMLLGLGAGLFYAAAVLVNKAVTGIGPYDRTILQMFTASFAVMPYALLTEPIQAVFVSLPIFLFVLLFGILYSGIAYTAYFIALEKLPVTTASLFGYVDPSVAILLSATILHQPFGWTEAVGIVCILGATVLAEWPAKQAK